MSWSEVIYTPGSCERAHIAYGMVSAQFTSASSFTESSMNTTHRKIKAPTVTVIRTAMTAMPAMKETPRCLRQTAVSLAKT